MDPKSMRIENGVRVQKYNTVIHNVEESIVEINTQEYAPPGKEVEFSRLWDKAMLAKENLDRQLIPAKYADATFELLKVYEEMFEWGMK